MTYRVREYERPVKKHFPVMDGMNPYWVYCSNEIYDYYEAIRYAIVEEKRTGIKNWVECMDLDSYV
jgi:hypothetical protein